MSAAEASRIEGLAQAWTAAVALATANGVAEAALECGERGFHGAGAARGLGR
ncbi:hypothetical protein ACU4GD_37250 [Cupriavidus basilensis]